MLIMNPNTTTKNKVQKSMKLSTYYNSQNYTLLLTTLYYPGSMTLVKQVVQHQLLSYLTFARSFSIYLIVVHCSKNEKTVQDQCFFKKWYQNTSLYKISDKLMVLGRIWIVEINPCVLKEFCKNWLTNFFPPVLVHYVCCFDETLSRVPE